MKKTQIEEAAAFLRQKGFDRAVAGVVLGTGLNALAGMVRAVATVPYEDIPHFPVSTVEFHKGKLLFGYIGNTPVVIMQGRFHYYEGYSLAQVCFPVRVMKLLGIQYLLLSNAAGGINPGFEKGDLVITEDHLNFLPDNPLRGLSSEFGNRFVDMSRPYDAGLRSKMASAFETMDIRAKSGVYAAVAGPNLETRAEYRWLRNSGADLVGMSTVPEVIVANQEEIACAAVSVVTDICDPDNLQPVNIAEIIEIAGKADEKLAAAFAEVLAGL